ncbi:MAG TPA: 7-cyano-7-deazaguanine synthase, partial [Polyangiaceae bacterium]|nr:7-cyano-7-deazaguanine synthase [Polyangiaceae bacterium]
MAKAKARKSKPTTPARGDAARARVLILLSGGIDSACALAAYRADRHPASALFVDYGQPARRSERVAAEAIARHYRVPLSTVKLGVGLPGDNGEFFGRNALLVLLGGAIESNRPLIVALGIHSASPYYDTTSTFASDAQRVLDGYAKGAITLGAPFLTLTKQTVVDYARRHRVPLRLTYSCERRNAPACGECPSCGDRSAFGV